MTTNTLSPLTQKPECFSLTARAKSTQQQDEKTGLFCPPSFIGNRAIADIKHEGSNMDSILFTAPDSALPEINSPTYKLLVALSDCKKHARDSLCSELGGGFRSYLQQLMGEHYQHWLIHTEQNEYNDKKQALYWLDERHFSCDCELDKDARTIARKQYKDRSYYGAKNSVKRLEQAKQEKAEADKEYKQRIESKKPVEE
jgi:hypothetical protein